MESLSVLDEDHTSLKDDGEAPKIAFDASFPLKNGQEAQPDDANEGGSHPPSKMTIRKRVEDGEKPIDAFTDNLRLFILSVLEEKTQGPVKAEAENDEAPAKRVTYTSEVRRLKWPEFKNKWKNDCEIPAVEALIGEESFWYQHKPNSKSMDTSDVVDETQQSQGSSNHKEVVKRLRINSRPILKILSDIDDGGWEIVSTVMMYPFKLLICREKQIRDRLERLEKIWRHADLAETNILSSASQIDSTTFPKQFDRNSGQCLEHQVNNEGKLEAEDSMDSLKAMKDLRCFVRFMDEHIFPTIPNFEDSSRTKGLFRELWYLFKPGDEIFVPRLDEADEKRPSKLRDQSRKTPVQTRERSKRYQEDWRIIECGGGRLKTRREGYDCNNSKRINSFQVLAYYLDFDGEKYTPV